MNLPSCHFCYATSWFIHTNEGDRIALYLIDNEHTSRVANDERAVAGRGRYVFCARCHSMPDQSSAHATFEMAILAEFDKRRGA